MRLYLMVGEEFKEKYLTKIIFYYSKPHTNLTPAFVSNYSRGKNGSTCNNFYDPDFS